MVSVCSVGLVLVEFGYEYVGRDGCMVSIKPNERYTLLAKTNSHWWHVRKDEHSKPFYVPAKYVKELPACLPSPLDFAGPPGAESRPPAPDLAEKVKPTEVTIRIRSPGNCRKTENRMSTFGVPLELHETSSYLAAVHLAPPPDAPPPQQQQKKRLSLGPGLLFGPRGAAADDAAQKARVPSFSPADPLPRQAKTVDPPQVKNLKEARQHGLPPRPEPLLLPEEEPGQDSTPSSDSENIYESILDLKLDDLIKTEAAGLCEPTTSTPSSAPSDKSGKLENEDPSMAVYANVTDLKKVTSPSVPSSASTCSSPGVSLSPPPDSATLPANGAGWEVHTDQDSGKAFYYHPATQQSSWSDPRSPPPPDGAMEPVSASTSPALLQGSDWEQLLDDTTGRHYYYNPTLKQTSWVAPEPISPAPLVDVKPTEGPPPLPKEDYPADEHEPLAGPHPSRDVHLPQIKHAVLPRVTLDPGTPVPAGWTCTMEPGGKNIFTSEQTKQQWIQSKDEKGNTYYYSRDGSKSTWTLPESSVAGGQPTMGNGVEQDLQKNWRPHVGQHNAMHEEQQKFFPAHQKITSDHGSEASSAGNSPETHHQEDKARQRRNLSSTDVHHHHGSQLEKAGILNKTKVADNGKKLRKNWTQSWTVLHGGILTFHKDPKSTPAGIVSKTNQIVPEYTVELKGAAVGWASKEKSSKKNVLELKTRHGSEYLIQYDTDSIIHDWHKIIQDTIRHLDHDHYSEEEEDEVMEKPPQPADKERKNTAVRQSSTSAADTEQGRVRTKLRKFLQRRPTLQSVKEKGYIKDNVFGCHLDTLCHRENTTVPRFVEKCIRVVERRGLNTDGIYRVSGNLAVIQKLRYIVDREEDLDLDDGQWEEIHVITGALKLFFRELPEPLFPYSFFDKFIAAIKISDYSQKVSYMQDLVRLLPLPNYNTMEVLFKHLRKVIEHGESNRMSVQSTAIVFGPTLLRPEEETGNITVHMVFQNQIVELILNEFNEVFRPR